MNFNVKPYNAWCLITNPDSTNDTEPIPNMITIGPTTQIDINTQAPNQGDYYYNGEDVNNNKNWTCKKYPDVIITYKSDSNYYLSSRIKVGENIQIKSGLIIPGNNFKNLKNLIKHCRPICIGGKKYKNGIPPNITHIKGSHSLMFWFKIKKELFDPSKESLSFDYPLVYFSNSNITPNYNLSNSLGFFITPINNTMKLKQNGIEISTIYNLPYDKWVCVTSVVNNKTIDIYINGRLLKTSVPSTLSNYNNLFLKWGPFPGDLAFVEVNNDLDELNAQSVYKNFKYYYGIIDKYKNHTDKKILLNTPFFKSPFKPLTHWDMLKGNTSNRTYNNVCY